MPPHGASQLLLKPGMKIVETSKVIFPLLSGRLSALEEAIDWLQFTFTSDWKGDNLSPASTFLVQYLMTEGDLIFALALDHLHMRFSGAYNPPPPSSNLPTLGSLRPK